MSANFRAQIDIAALTKGVPDVRTLRQELEKLVRAADNAEKPRRFGLDLGPLANQLHSVTPGVQSLMAAVNGLTSAFTGQASAAKAAGQAQVASLQTIQAQMQKYIAMANQAAAASARIKVGAPASTPTGLGSGVGTSLGVAAAGAAAYGGIKSLVDAGIEIQGVKASLTAANHNDAQAAAADYQYLTEQALKFGAGLKAVGKEYANIKIAAELAGKAQGFSAEHADATSKALFESLLKFKTAMGKSDADVSLVTKAFTDMLSKGTVASEELKKQLGNQMPGAFAMGAAALGLTTTELMTKLKAGAINAYQFVALMTGQINATYGAAADKHASDMQASLTRVSVSWQLLKDSVGQAGLFDAVARSANELSKYLASPEGKSSARELGLALKDIATTTIEAVKAAAGFYREHKAGIDTAAQVLAVFLGLNLALKAFTGLLSTLFGPLVALATKLGAVSEAVGPLGTAITGLGAGMTGAVTAAGGLGSAMAALGAKLMGSPYAALLAVANVIKQINDGRNFSALGQRINSYQDNLVGDPEKLKGRISDLKNLIAKDEASTMANLFRWGSPNGDAAKRLAKSKADLANYERLLASYNAGSPVRDFQGLDFAVSNNPDVRSTVFGPGKVKADKAGLGQLGTAESQAAKAELRRDVAEINSLLEQNAIGFDSYVDKMKDAYAKELNAQVASLDEQLKNVRDPSRREAIKKERIAALTDGYLAEIATLETQTDQKRKQLRESLLGVQSELARATGETAAQSLATIEKKYSDTMAKLKANGDEAGVETIKRLVNVEYATARIKELNAVLAADKLSADTQQAELQAKVADGVVTATEAEARALEIKREEARLNLVIYQQQLEIANASERNAVSDAQRLTALQKIAEAKTVLAEKTKTEQTLEADISRGMAQSVADVTTGTNSVGKAITNMLTNVRNALNKMITDMLAEQLKKAMFGSGSGGSLLGSLGGFLVNGAMGLLGMGSSGSQSSGLFSANAEATVASGLQSFNSTDVVGVGGQSTMPSATTVQNFNWSINAVDPNQFRNTQAQTLRDASLAATPA